MDKSAMNTPKFSVIVPVYNKEKYVGKLIESVKAQRFRDYECLLIDDGSTDSSGIVCDRLTEGDIRFTVIHIVNTGVSHARNVALDKACGEYITFLDSDDEIPTDYLHKIAYDIYLYSPDMVIGSIKRVNDTSSTIKSVPFPYLEKKYSLSELLPKFAELQQTSGFFGWCVNKTFKRSCSNGIRFDESLSLCEDLDFYIKLYPYIQTFYFDSSVYYLYYYERSNFSSYADNEIDYLAQAVVNIRLKQFLVQQNYWFGNNKMIVSDSIQRFLYFSVFHSPIKCFDKSFKDAYYYYRLSDIQLSFNSGVKGIIQMCIARGKCTFAKILIVTYRWIKLCCGNITKLHIKRNT